MHSPFSLEKDGLIVTPEIYSAGRLLECGFLCVRQGRYVEGLAFFGLARQRLSPEQVQLASALDALAQSHASYLRTQEELLQASKHFAKADAEQQAQIGALEVLFSSVRGKVSTHVDGLQQHAEGQSLLHMLLPSSSDLPTDRAPGGLTVDSVPFPGLYITCFGHFEVKRADTPIVLCSSRTGQAILRYLVAQPGHSSTIDKLMTLLWPDDEAEVAQRKLHIAVSALRRSLNQEGVCEGGGYILCRNRVYLLNMALGIQTDVDEFLHYYQVGRQAGAKGIAAYEKACYLYTGPFLTEDLYADWSFLQREQLAQTYVSMCRVLAKHYLQEKHFEDAAKWATAILKETAATKPPISNSCRPMQLRDIVVKSCTSITSANVFSVKN